MFRKYCNLLLLAGVMVLIVVANATAGNRPFAFTLTPQIGLMVYEGNQNLEPSLATHGLALGYNFGAHWGAEGVFTDAHTEQTKKGDRVDVKTAHFDLLYHFLPQKSLVPYLSLALGGMVLEDDKDVLAGYGVGFKYFFTDGVAFRLDLKHLLDINYHDTQNKRSAYNMLVATTGVSFQFGGDKLALTVNDSDDDGVVDVVDRCPGTPSRVNVDEVGCPVKVPPVKISDRDGDGIADNLDLCPDTATGVAVDRNGCLVADRDLDGVIDAQDACPGTPVKTVVDARGCPVTVVVLPRWDDVPVQTFYLSDPPNTAEVCTEFSAELQKMADFITANPGRRFIIEGHTDSIGNDDENRKLSLLRAEKITTYLAGKTGISAALFEARGFGENNPVADNRSQEGRRLNRRIVIIALPQ